ncbi:MAG: carboxypeptidase regulatory-like domain-containing protein [Planctomycetes bacterium]|nr:carboxypeptidase regulatory-like domain-containing protein [Planctomycetota bacterium]
MSRLRTFYLASLYTITLVVLCYALISRCGGNGAGSARTTIASVIRGSVIAIDGRPVRHPHVELHRIAGNHDVDGPLVVPEAEPAYTLVGDERGTYRLDDVRPGIYQIAIEANDLASYVRCLSVPETPWRMEVSPMLGYGENVLVHLADEGGRPVSGLRVALSRMQDVVGDLHRQVWFSRSDARGEAHFPRLPCGPLRAYLELAQGWIEADYFWESPKPEWTDAASALRGCYYELEHRGSRTYLVYSLTVREPRPVWGTVEDGEGNPLPGAIVSCRHDWIERKVVSDASGSFSLLASSRWGPHWIGAELRAHHPGLGEAVWHPDEDELRKLMSRVRHGTQEPIGPLRLVLGSLPRLRGRVLDACTSEPLRGVEVRVHHPESMEREPPTIATTSTEGVFDVPIRGTVFVEVRAPDHYAPRQQGGLVCAARWWHSADGGDAFWVSPSRCEVILERTFRCVRSASLRGRSSRPRATPSRTRWSRCRIVVCVPSSSIVPA